MNEADLRLFAPITFVFATAIAVAEIFKKFVPRTLGKTSIVFDKFLPRSLHRTFAILQQIGRSGLFAVVRPVAATLQLWPDRSIKNGPQPPLA